MIFSKISSAFIIADLQKTLSLREEIDRRKNKIIFELISMLQKQKELTAEHAGHIALLYDIITTPERRWHKYLAAFIAGAVLASAAFEWWILKGF